MIALDLLHVVDVESANAVATLSRFIEYLSHRYRASIYLSALSYQVEHVYQFSQPKAGERRLQIRDGGHRYILQTVVHPT